MTKIVTNTKNPFVLKLKMRYYFFIILLLLSIILGNSCRKNLEYAPSAGNLEFSKDTVFLDTIFTNIASSTHTLKVYNRTRDDIEIPSIQLAKGENSKYRLNVDGIAGKNFKNIPIFAQDSLFIFIETTIDNPSLEKEFLYTDAIEFDAGDFLQQVELVTLVKEAIFIYPRTLSNGTKETFSIGVDELGNEVTVMGSSLKENQLVFSKDKPYVIYGYAKVPRSKKLVIDAGARVYFHKDSGIYVESGATIEINGRLSEDQETLENEVIFQGDRLNETYKTLSGQWGSTYIASGSTANKINHLTIKNATIGLVVEGNGRLETPTLEIQNTQIYNSSSVGLWSKTAFINGQNLVLGSAGKTSLFCSLGGKYSFKHCTIANYWSTSFRVGTALEINNFNTTQAANLSQANFINCIIDGNSSFELSLASNQSNSFEYSFTNCSLKFIADSNNNSDLYDFENRDKFDQIFFNEDINFLNVAENDFRIGKNETSNSIANNAAAVQVPLDILGIDRTNMPTIGAYQEKSESENIP